MANLANSSFSLSGAQGDGGGGPLLRPRLDALPVAGFWLKAKRLEFKRFEVSGLQVLIQVWGCLGFRALGRKAGMAGAGRHA